MHKNKEYREQESVVENKREKLTRLLTQNIIKLSNEDADEAFAGLYDMFFEGFEGTGNMTETELDTRLLEMEESNEN